MVEHSNRDTEVEGSNLATDTGERKNGENCNGLLKDYFCVKDSYNKKWLQEVCKVPNYEKFYRNNICLDRLSWRVCLCLKLLY